MMLFIGLVSMVWLSNVMKARRYVMAVAVLLALGACHEALAQRTMPGQAFVDAGGRWPLGAYVGAGGYSIPGYWSAGLGASRQTERLSYADAGEGRPASLESWRAGLLGGYMFRLVATRSRGASLYAGARGYVAIERIDPFGRLPQDILLDLDAKGAFVFGVAPRLEAEVYLAGPVALYVAGDVPVTFLSQIRTFSARAQMGLRIAL